MSFFKSDIHRTLFQRMLVLEIKSHLFKRFGGTRQEECRLLRSKSSKIFINEWANYILQRMPSDHSEQTEHIKHEIKNLNQQLLKQSHIKVLLEEDRSLRWLVERIRGVDDVVPEPYYPSVLCNRMLQYPFKPYEIDKARELYGLLKFPFYSLTADIHPEPSEKFTKLSEHQKEVKDNLEFSTTNHIYAPSELETGLHRK